MKINKLTAQYTAFVICLLGSGIFAYLSCGMSMFTDWQTELIHSALLSLCLFSIAVIFLWQVIINKK